MYYIKTDKQEIIKIHSVDILYEGPYSYINITARGLINKVMLFELEHTGKDVNTIICANCGKMLFDDVIYTEVESVYTETYGLTAQHIERKGGYILNGIKPHLYVNKKQEFICQKCYDV